MHLKCNHRGTFCCKLRLHKCPWSRVMTNLPRRPKSAIFWDFAKGGPRENAQKSRPTIRASKTPWRKSHHRLISMHLKCNHRGTFCCKLRLHKCPWSRVMTNLPRRPNSAIFLDFAKGAPRENAQKSRPTIRAWKKIWHKSHHRLINMHLKCNHRGTFCCKLRLHKCPWSRVMANLPRRRKSAIFWDFAKGGPRENAQKSRPNIRAWKKTWHKSHHRLINMHLKCNHRGTFCCKLRLHKCPWSRVMTNLPRRPKSAIFWDFAKGGPRENAQKSRLTIRASKTPWRKSHHRLINMHSKGGPREDAQKSRPTIRASKPHWRKSHHRLISMHLKCNYEGTFCCKLRLHKCPWSRVMTNSPKRPKSAIFWDFAKGGPRENAQKSRATLRASKTTWRKSHYRLISMHLKCNYKGTFCCKLRLHKCPWSRVMTNFPRRPKSAFFWDFAKGGPRENAQKGRPNIRASKTPWRKSHHRLISMHLKCNHRGTFCCKLRLHKCPWSRVMTNLPTRPKSANFWDFAKGAPRENAQKSSPTIRAWKKPWNKSHHHLINMQLKSNHRGTFCCKLRLHKCPWSRVMANLPRRPKSAIFWDFAKGGPRENAQKSRPTIRAWKKTWHKSHHRLINMHLKCNHRGTFCCKLRLHKCPWSRVMTNLPRRPKSAIFWDFAKGAPRENAQKSRPTIRASKPHWRKSHHRLISMHLKCNYEGTFCCKLRLHKCPWSRVMTNSPKRPKSAIFWDFAKGGPRENAQKSRPTLRASKTTWRKSHHRLISMHLKCNYEGTFCCRLRLYKCPWSRVMTNLPRRLNRPFSEILPRGHQGKMLKKVGQLYGLQKQPGANRIIA